MVKELDQGMSGFSHGSVVGQGLVKPLRLSPRLVAKNAIRLSKAIAFAVVYKLTGMYGLIPFGTYLIHQYGYWVGLGIVNVLAMVITILGLMTNQIVPAKPVEAGSGKKSFGALSRLRVIKSSVRFVQNHRTVRDFLLGVWFGPPLTQVVYRALNVRGRRLITLSVSTSVGYCLVWYSLYGGLGTIAWRFIHQSSRYLPFT